MTAHVFSMPMETPDLDTYLRTAVAEHLGGDTARFAELWERPGFAKTVQDLTRESGDVHWRTRTLDGWYCVETSAGYDVYYQERGIASDVRTFSTQGAAATYFLRTLGYLR